MMSMRPAGIMRRNHPEEEKHVAEVAEVGKTYEVEIVEETTDEGPYGIAYIGEAIVTVPNAKIGDKVSVKITAVVPNYFTNRKEAFFIKA